MDKIKQIKTGEKGDGIEFINTKRAPRKSGFIDLPIHSRCVSPEHNPPMHLHIPQGKAYVHVCPCCDREIIIYPSN